MNIFILLTTVTLMPTVPTPKDHSRARVIRDTLGMVSRVLVGTLILLCVFDLVNVGLFRLGSFLICADLTIFVEEPVFRFQKEEPNLSSHVKIPKDSFSAK